MSSRSKSTGIFFIQHGIEELVSHFPAQYIERGDGRSYNRAVAECIDGVRDFLTLHYCAAARTDTAFWRATRSVVVSRPGSGTAGRCGSSACRTTRTSIRDYHGFEFYSYSVMLLGLGYRPSESLPALDHLDAPTP